MALQRGDTGPLVLAAQVLLRVPRTGTFDAITELAVVQLQQKFGLPVNGILDTAEYTAARHASSHETAGADPINPAAITGAPWVLKSGDTMTGDLSAPKIGVGTAASSLSGNKLTVGTGLGSFVTGAVAHFVDNSTQATVNYQNTNAAGFTAFDLFAHTGIKAATFAWSNASAAYLPGALWFMTRVTADMVLGTNTTERLRITAAGDVRVATSLSIGSGGTAITKRKVYTPSLVPALVSAGAPVEQTFYIIGLSMSDMVSVNAPAMAVFSARVSAADTLAITFFPPAAGSYTPPSGVYRVLADRS
jgi:peptidoglycan hydrolase-like protein with peptidoglycan-binding domain